MEATSYYNTIDTEFNRIYYKMTCARSFGIIYSLICVIFILIIANTTIIMIRLCNAKIL